MAWYIFCNLRWTVPCNWIINYSFSTNSMHIFRIYSFKRKKKFYYCQCYLYVCVHFIRWKSESCTRVTAFTSFCRSSVTSRVNGCDLHAFPPPTPLNCISGLCCLVGDTVQYFMHFWGLLHLCISVVLIYSNTFLGSNDPLHETFIIYIYKKLSRFREILCARIIADTQNYR